MKGFVPNGVDTIHDSGGLRENDLIMVASISCLKVVDLVSKTNSFFQSSKKAILVEFAPHISKLESQS